jgi:hypothetical protein
MKNKNKTVILVFCAIAVLAIVSASYFYNQLRLLKQNPQTAALQEVKDLVAKVSLLIVLPQGETPTVATVSDPTALKDQVFFANAEKGDKVLIYTNSKKAILYRPSINRIIEVAPINVGSNTPNVTPPVSDSVVPPAVPKKTTTAKRK